MDCIVHGVAKSQTQLSDFHLKDFEAQLQRRLSTYGKGTTPISNC